MDFLIEGAIETRVSVSIRPSTDTAEGSHLVMVGAMEGSYGDFCMRLNMLEFSGLFDS